MRLLGAPLTYKCLLSWGFFLLLNRNKEYSEKVLSGTPLGPFWHPWEAIWGSPGALLGHLFGQSRPKRPGKGPESHPRKIWEGFGGAQGQKKVVQEGSWRLLADLKTRF